MAPQAPPMSGLAIASLVTGIVSCVPPLGLILGAFALGKIKREGQRGKGMAVAGMVLSTISVVLVVVSIVTGGLADSWAGFKEGWNSSVGTRSTLDLRKGDCFNVPGGKLEREVVSVQVVPCSDRHDGEVSGSFRLSGGDTYPGTSVISAQADTRCLTLGQEYAMDRWKVPTAADPYYYTPSRESWGFGDHTVTCAFASQGSKLQGSVRNDATSLDADQIAFLRAANAIDSVMDKAPDEDRVEDDVPGFRTWAAKVAVELDVQTGALSAHHWPAGSAAAVQPYIDGLKSAQKEWQQASGATDADTFYQHSAAAAKGQRQSTEITARASLHLATTPPATGGGSEGDGDGGREGVSGGGSGTGGSKSV
ncbi:DUF4190 domain-containing protein [Streptomyces sp. Edi4]|uniref:DUF4190 domain-containing protein n=1 Tax=Streptomyces sp. Edi4 TaxID=3162527 RepID=UPI0033056122